MKKLYPLVLTSSILFGSDFTIEPVGDLQLRYENKTKTYTPLGQSIYKKEKNSYDDSVFGGTFGLKGKYEEFEVASLVYGSKSLQSKESDTLKIEKTIHNNTFDDYAYLGELYLKSTINNHTFTLGRQTKNSSLIDTNHRLTNNSYEALRYQNIQEKSEFEIFYFDKVSSSSLANSVPFNHKYGFLGYGLGFYIDGFADISTHILNKNYDTAGAFHLQGKIGDKANYARVENLFVDNFFDTFYLEGKVSSEPFSFRTALVYQTSVGENVVEKHYGKNLESKLYQGEVEYKKENLSLTYRVAHTPSDTNAIYNGTMLSPFSNKVAWIVGLNTAHGFIADTTSQQIMLLNTINSFRVPFTFVTSYVQYDIGKNNGLQTNPIKTKEFYGHIRAYLSKQLSCVAQYSKVKDIDILTENTEDTRLYLEYKF